MYDYDRCRRHLAGFYGYLARIQNQVLIERLQGRTVLDAGAGAGTLVRHLQENGIACTGIDPCPEQVEFAREVNGVEILPRSVYETGFSPGEFDALVLRESVSHLEFDRVLSEADRLGIRQIMILDSNLILPLRVLRRLTGHVEKNVRSFEYYVELSKKAGFDSVEFGFQDVIAFPLSGGLYYPCVVPNIPAMWQSLATVDHVLNACVGCLHIQRYMCWQYWIDARKSGA